MSSWPVYKAHLLLTDTAAGYFRLGHADGALGGAGVAKLMGDFPDSSWTDVSSRLFGFETRHGRSESQADGVTAGGVVASLHNDDGALDPENATSPYYPMIRLNRRLRIQAVWDSVTYTLGHGYLDSNEPQAFGIRADNTLTATDLFKRLARKPIRMDFPAQMINERLGVLLDLVNWPADKRVLPTSHLMVPGERVETTALSHADKLVRAERGVFTMRGDGWAVFQPRYYRQSQTSIGTFGAGTALRARAVVGAQTEEGLANSVSISLLASPGNAPTMYTVEDQTSILENGVVEYNIGDDVAQLLGDDLSRVSFAQGTLNARKNPQSRIRSVELNGIPSPATMWPLVLASTVGQKIVLTHDVPGTKGLTSTSFYIEGVTHRVSIGVPSVRHSCTWTLTKATTTTYWTLGSTTNAQLGTGVLGF